MVGKVKKIFQGTPLQLVDGGGGGDGLSHGGYYQIPLGHG